jgi:tetratricopeptide (TPR) repeat protein
MPGLFRISLFFLLVFFSLSVCGAISIDTTVKRMNPILRSNNLQRMDFTADIRDGIRNIRSDSLEIGVHVLVAGIKKVISVTKMDRMLGYSQLEFFNLAEQIDDGKLSSAEKQIGLQFCKMLFKDADGTSEKEIITDLRQAPNTLFIRRVKVWVNAMDDPQKAGPLINNLLKEQPDLLTANILKAEWLFDRQKYKECMIYCDKSLVIFPSYAFAYNLRAECEANTAQSDKELADENRAIKLFPDYTEAWYNKGSFFLDSGMYKDAIACYQKTGRLAPHYYYSFYNLARCYKALKINDSAMYYVDIHNQLNPDDADGYNLKGSIYYEQDDYPAAIEWYTQAIKLKPEDEAGYEGRGDAWFYDKKIDSALLDFEKAASLDKKLPYPEERIGDCYYEKEQYDKSIIYHQKALQIDPSYKYAWVSIDYCYTKMNKYDLAIEACKKALAIDSTYDSALGDLGWNYYCVGRFDDCITYSYKALKYDESATYVMFNIALSTLRKGDYENAKVLYQHFLDLCKEKKYEVNSGAAGDLKDLIKEKIMVEQATYIIRNIFKDGI